VSTPPSLAELYTHTLADYLAQPEPPSQPAALCGRITLIAEAKATAPRVLFDDGQAACFLVGPALSAVDLRLGDFVRIVPLAVSLAHGQAPPCLHIAALEVLARPTDGAQFLSPDDDWYRLQKNGRRRMQLLSARASLLSAVRRFFAERDFIEIEAPLLVPSPGLELHLAAFSTQPGGRYLITSPEYQCKRLLAGGLRRIFSLGKVFRAGEAGPHHNPEFTMLEWYRAYSGWQAVAHDVAALCASLAALRPGGDGTPRIFRGEQVIDLSLPWPMLSVRTAMARHAGVTLRGDESLDELAQAITSAGHSLPPAGPSPLTWDELFFHIFLDHVEPKLFAPETKTAPLRPVILHDWPLPLCALARPCPEDPAVVERFEAYVAGLELCNGFGELCDPAEQRRRLQHDADERARRGLPVYPLDDRFLQALSSGMPPSSGVALGLDRLLMLLSGAEHIRDVLPFAADEL